jgi:phytoene desaturase
MNRSAVVVGAGPGGLAAAMLLAASGVDVTVVEQGREVGGRSRRIDLGPYKFDTGPTFFIYPRVLREIFRTCGSDLDAAVEMRRLDPMYRLSFLAPDGSADHLRLWSDAARSKEALAAFCPEDAAGLDRFLAENRRKLAAFEPALSKPASTLADLLHPAVLKGLVHLKPWRSVDQDLARHFKDPRVRLAFSFQSKYLGMSPYRCPSLFTILAFLEHEHGVWHPTGGCNAVIEAMADAARAMGVRIRLDTPVQELLFEGRRAVGVRTDEGTVKADAVVLNADFAHAMSNLVPDRLRRRWTDSRLAKKRFSCSTFMLYLGIEGSVDLDHHTIALSEDYQGHVEAIESGDAPPETPSIYVQNASRTDATLAPDGHSTLYVLVPVANTTRGIDWTAARPPFRELVMRRLATLGIERLPERIRAERVMTPLHWESELSVQHGATFNLAHSLDQMMLFRPHNRFEDLDGVYLVGGGTHPGSGLPVIFEGARITTRLMADDLGFRHADAGGAVRTATAGDSAWPEAA